MESKFAYIACWFIDTNYNGESFFVGQVYFTGADEPYDYFRRALSSEIDKEARSALYSTVSRPFARPESGKIAVKVINHYDAEVLKIFGVQGVAPALSGEINWCSAALARALGVTWDQGAWGETLDIPTFLL